MTVPLSVPLSGLPACVGMTDRYDDTELNIILEDISET